MYRKYYKNAGRLAAISDLANSVTSSPFISLYKTPAMSRLATNAGQLHITINQQVGSEYCMYLPRFTVILSIFSHRTLCLFIDLSQRVVHRSND